MVVIFIVLIAFIFPVFFTVAAIAGSVLVSMLEYSQLIGLWIVFNTAFMIQTVIAIISKIKKKKFGKGNAIRTIIFGIICSYCYSDFSLQLRYIERSFLGLGVTFFLILSIIF